MTRGHKQDLSCWSKECNKLLNKYEQTRSDVTAERLIRLLYEERRQRWVNAMEEIRLLLLKPEKLGPIKKASHRSTYQERKWLHSKRSC